MVGGEPRAHPRRVSPSWEVPTGSGGRGRAPFAEDNCIDSVFGHSAMGPSVIETFLFAIVHLLFSPEFPSASWRRDQRDSQRSADPRKYPARRLFAPSILDRRGLSSDC